METYLEFSDRINGFEKREMNLGGEYFKVNPSLSKKVNADNTLKSFYGDTVVFALDNSVKNKLAEYVNFLYRAAPECFCQKLNPDTFHVTLHDLSNSEYLNEVEEERKANAAAVRQLEVPKNTKIKFKSKYIFNMVNTSLVLGLYPAGEDNYKKLMQLYSIFDGVKKLNYPLTPHITLGYYNVNGFCADSARKLENAVNALNGERQFEFETQGLYYQQFTNMNDYTNLKEFT
ncbi:MAG: ligT like phosphoesterase [Clostridia bacterium]|nr:ligT like phosphoesterase [Clostridia bacterium]